MNLLRAENIEYIYRSKYQTVKALNGITFEFEKGKFYTIIGPSGSGKTTFLSLLAGLDIPTKGNLYFNDVSTKNLNCDEYRFNNVSIVYQNFNLIPELTVLENTALPQTFEKKDKKKVLGEAKNALFSVGITEEKYNVFPNMLSGGEQQRVAIARALTSKNSIILADEPTGNLDKNNSSIIVNILKNLAHEKNCCVIVVTHDIDISKNADVILKIEDGSLSPM